MRNTYKFISGIMIYVLTMQMNAFSISIIPTTRGNIPSCLGESSGIDNTVNSQFWSLNDSGNSNQIYCIGSDGSVTRAITITNATNVDWEDMTHDYARNNMYIGDFGNNSTSRTDLKVYKIPYPSNINGNSVTAEEIRFSYPDQTSFPSPWLNFDAEAMVHFQGQLYIFSKGYGNSMGYTKMYSIPDVAGTYIATLVDSFHTYDRTTSAAISPDGSTMLLLSYTHLHLFRNFSGANFFGGQHTMIDFGGTLTQKEAVCFTSSNEIYMTDENTGSGNHLYYADLSQWIPASPTNSTAIKKINTNYTINAYPSPANEYVNILLKNVNADEVKFSLFDLTGKSVYETFIENPLVPLVIPTDVFPSGVYFYKVYADAKELKTSRLIISH